MKQWNGMSGQQKALAIFVVLVVGLFLYGRWTGKSFSLQLLGQNQLGASVNASAAAVAAGKASGPVDHTNAQTGPVGAFQPIPNAFPPSATSGVKT